MDELLRKSREALEPAWDFEREENILDRVLSAEDEAGEPVPFAAPESRASGWTGVFWASGVVVAAAAALALLALDGSEPSETSPRTVAFPAPAAQVKSLGKDTPSVLTFFPGTRAIVDPGAEVTTISQDEGLVSLRQESGRVLYEVDPRREQRFRVAARGVLVEVIGTVFAVDVVGEDVSIEVQRGVVSVKTDDRELRLHEGESFHTSSQAEREESEDESTKERSTGKAVPSLQTSVDSLMKEADRARRAGDLEAAEQALRQVAYGRPGASASASALFSLGRVLRARGKANESARAFADVQKRTAGSLAEDALAEEAVSLAQAGKRSVAAERAKKYLATHPEGIHRRRMEQLAR